MSSLPTWKLLNLYVNGFHGGVEDCMTIVVCPLNPRAYTLKALQAARRTGHFGVYKTECNCADPNDALGFLSKQRITQDLDKSHLLAPPSRRDTIITLVP